MDHISNGTRSTRVGRAVRMSEKFEITRSGDLVTLVSAHRMATIATFIHTDPSFFTTVEEYKERIMAAKLAFNLKDMPGTRGRSSAEARRWAIKQVQMSPPWKRC